jgi:hypothetical protein
VEAGLKGGYDVMKSLPPKTLFLWLGKIFYGLLMREYFLRADRRDPRKGNIVPRALLDRYDLHHTFLQAARLPTVFVPGVPATVVVFPLKCPAQASQHFDLRDSLQLMTISVRLGDVGILAALQDGRALQSLALEYENRFTKTPLHPLQFLELTSHFFYSASLLNRTPKFILAETPTGVQVHHLPLAGMSSKPVFDPWDQREYANTLSAFTGQPMTDVFESPDRVLSYLGDGKGEVPDLDLESGGVFDRLHDEPG